MATITGGKPNQNGATLKVGQIIGRKGTVFAGSGLTGGGSGGGGFSTAAGSGGGSGGAGSVEISWHANYAAFPPVGTADIVYVSKDTGQIYQWDGGGYSGLAEAGGYTNLQIDTLLAGKADLVGGLVPANQLPSYVDEIIEAGSVALFPVTGEFGKLYAALDSGLIYRWSGSVYVEISSSSIPNASAIPSAQTGDVSATNVQAAIAELASEKTTPAAVLTQLLTPKIDVAVEAVAVASISGTYNYDINGGAVARLTLSANAIIGLTAPTGLVSGTAVCVTMFVNPVTYTADWAADIDWGDTGAPTLTASKWNRVVFSKVYGDTNWQASIAGTGFAL